MDTSLHAAGSVTGGGRTAGVDVADIVVGGGRSLVTERHLTENQPVGRRGDAVVGGVEATRPVGQIGRDGRLARGEDHVGRGEGHACVAGVDDGEVCGGVVVLEEESTIMS